MNARIAALEATVAETKMMLEATAIACGQHADALRVAEATVARLTAEVGDDEATRFWKDRDELGTTASALTAFLERRMKG